jgi:hypothetical protein
MKSITVIIVALIIAAAVAVPLSIYLAGKAGNEAIGGVAKGPGVALRELISACTSMFDNKTRTEMTQQTLTFTPISEIALAQHTVRLTNVYKRTWYGSECVAVTRQDYIVKYGYDTAVVFRIPRGGAVDVPEPKILSVEPVTGAPELLYSAGGWWNSLSVKDMQVITNETFQKVREDTQVRETKAILRSIVVNQLKALQKEVDEAKLWK